jgi:chromosome segregation ATPase
MDTQSAIVAILKELGTPAITVIGFAWVIFKLNASKKDISELRTELKTDMSALDAKLSSSIAGLRTELKADISGLETKVSGLEAKVSGLEAKVSVLAVDVKSIKGNHLPHIEAAIKALAKGTPNEENVKAILDLSREVELKTSDNEQ